MEKEIESTKNETHYLATLRKLSLIMIIIGWIALSIIIVGFIFFEIGKKQIWKSSILDDIGFYLMFIFGAILVLLSLLPIWKIILIKKMTTISPKLTSKQALIAYATLFSTTWFGIIVAVVSFLIQQMLHSYANADIEIVFAFFGGAIALISILGTLILSTLVTVWTNKKK